MNPVDVMSGIYIDFDIEYDDKDPKFKVGYMWEYQNTKQFCERLHFKLVRRGIYGRKS